jgi:uncharacterized protein (TIGR02231 family)
MNRFLLLFLIFPLFSQSQEITTQTIKSNIDAVKLYLTAGEVIHNQDIKLATGRNKLIFSGISTYANPQSIQFTGSGNFRLVSVSTEMDFLAAEEFNPRISVLNDSLEVLKDKKQEIQDELAAYNVEQSVLNANKNINGKDASLTVAQIRDAANFFRERTLQISRKKSLLKKALKKNSKSIEDTRYQLVELNYNENQRSNQVIILVDSDRTESIKATLKYLVSDCGWAATYNLSADDLSQQISLKYKAQIYNNTGNDWTDVNLTLSTGDPQLSASHPELSPWYLSESTFFLKNKSRGLYEPKTEENKFREQAVSSINVANQRAYDNYVLDKGSDDRTDLFQFGNGIGDVKTQVQLKQIEISELTAEFIIKSRFSCPSDAKPYTLDIKEMNLDASFSHITVPKLDRSVFLIANIVGWQELDLIPGPTNVYFGGKYVGVSRIDTRNVADTLSLSFGRDNKVVVVRKLKSEMSTKKVIGNSKKDSYMFEIAVRNNRSTQINLKIYDQIPISTTSEIIIYDDELSGGHKSETTGEVVWNVNIASNGVSSKEIGYSVKYPKKSHVSVKRYRTVSAPSF